MRAVRGDLEGSARIAAGSVESACTHLLVVRVLDEHVGEFNLGAVDVLSSDEDGETASTALALEEGEDVAQLSGEEGRQDG